MAKARLNGIEIDYEATGRGRPVILSHGYGATRRMWNGQHATLGDRYRLVTWDMRGHGQTESLPDPAQYSLALTVGDIRALLQSLGGSFPRALSLVSLIYLIGAAIIWLAPETKGKPLPE